jgi:multidrug efflux pump subunit AcrA (membrane-fusion protein)
MTVIERVLPPSGRSSRGPAFGPAAGDRRGWRAAVVGVVLIAAGMLGLGTVPRLRRNAMLAGEARAVRSAAPVVQVVTPRRSTENSLTLPGNIQAVRETSIGARASGYVRRLYVDIGSRVKAGQVLAEIDAEELNQQVSQAAAQTAQSRAAVSESQATVAQQESTVVQNQATVAQNQAAVQQAYAQVESTRSKLSQAEAVEKQSEAGLAQAKQVLAQQQATLTQTQAKLALARVDYRRSSILAHRGFAAMQAADDDLTALRAAAANVGVSQAAVKAAQASVDAAAQAVAASQAAVASARSDLTASEKNAQATESALAATEAVVDATRASVQASQENVRANQALVTANQANAQRFAVLQGYQKVVAPFDGVITARNVDVGTLVTADAAGAGRGISGIGGATSSAPLTGLFGIAQTDAVRIDVSVPQSFASVVLDGSHAQVSVRELPGHEFTGTVTLRAGALDAASRTQQVQVVLPNRDGALTPGMYAEVTLSPANAPSTLRIPDTALVIDAQGTRVAVLAKDDRVRFQAVRIGQDLGQEATIVDGLQGGERLVNNPSDLLQEGAKVRVLTSP